MTRVFGFNKAVRIVLLGTLFLFLPGCKGSNSAGPYVPPLQSSQPAAVIGISAVSGDGSATINWSSFSGATSYSVYRSLVSLETGTVISTIPSLSTSYTDSNLSNGANYYYTIDAFDGSQLLARSSQVSVMPALPGATVIISGAVQYEDKIYAADGFTGEKVYKPVRYASIEIVGGEIKSTLTDSKGYYSISTSPTSTVYLRVFSDAALDGISPQAEVRNLSGDIYAAAGNNFVLSGNATVNISVPTTSPAAGAFNILDVFTNGLEFVHSLGGAYPAAGLSGYWQTNNPHGTYYCTGACYPGEGIYVYNDPTGDTDEYDDDVLYHEFGHFAISHFSRDDSPGGAHGLVHDDLDMRLAWSEGLGDAFPGALKTWLDDTSPLLVSSAPGVALTRYVDTSASSVRVSIDMQHPDGTYVADYRYATGEIAIAKILLDLGQQFGTQKVWDVLVDFKANPPIAPNPVNLELFWDRWNSLQSGTESTFGNRRIYYRTDVFDDLEDGNINSAATFTVNVAQDHLLYGPDDVDYVAFLAAQDTSYTITTSNLLNGADTVISLIRPDKTVLNENDNANNQAYSGLVPSDVFGSLCDTRGVCHENYGDVLGSRLSFTAASSDTYYVKIGSSPNRPLSAGRYGTYTLSITSLP